MTSTCFTWMTMSISNRVEVLHAEGDVRSRYGTPAKLPGMPEQTPGTLQSFSIGVLGVPVVVRFVPAVSVVAGFVPVAGVDVGLVPVVLTAPVVFVVVAVV